MSTCESVSICKGRRSKSLAVWRPKSRARSSVSKAVEQVMGIVNPLIHCPWWLRIIPPAEARRIQGWKELSVLSLKKGGSRGYHLMCWT